MVGHLSPSELIAQSLATLSSDLHKKVERHLTQSRETQEAQVNQALTELIPTLLTQLLPIITQEVQRQNQPMLEQVEACLNELKTTNQQQLKMLKLGREEYQSLQQRMKTMLTELDQLSLLDDDAVKNSLTKLQTSITSLQTQVTSLQNSQQDTKTEQETLSQLIGELETLKTDMAATLNNLKQQQTSLNSSLVQFQPLLKR